jgi:hypothetical protein
LISYGAIIQSGLAPFDAPAPLFTPRYGLAALSRRNLSAILRLAGKLGRLG